MRFTAVHLLAVITIIVGVAMVVQAVAGGGGLGSYGVLIGAFFIAGGIMRLRLMIVRDRVDRS